MLKIEIFLFTDEKEDKVLGSLPMLSFQIGGVEPLDNIARTFSFKVSNTLMDSRLGGQCVIAFDECNCY